MVSTKTLSEPRHMMKDRPATRSGSGHPAHLSDMPLEDEVPLAKILGDATEEPGDRALTKRGLPRLGQATREWSKGWSTRESFGACKQVAKKIDVAWRVSQGLGSYLQPGQFLWFGVRGFRSHGACSWQPRYLYTHVFPQDMSKPKHKTIPKGIPV